MVLIHIDTHSRLEIENDSQQQLKSSTKLSLDWFFFASYLLHKEDVDAGETGPTLTG
jgi:hypothetical protein